MRTNMTTSIARTFNLPPVMQRRDDYYGSTKDIEALMERFEPMPRSVSADVVVFARDAYDALKESNPDIVSVGTSTPLDRIAGLPFVICDTNENAAVRCMELRASGKTPMLVIK